MDVHDLPGVNAGLNSLAAVLLVSARVLIAQRKITAHRRTMLAAFATSVLFLISYLIYHSQVGSTRFTGQGWIRPVYFMILLSHTILATAIVPLAIITLRRGLRADFIRHARIARWAFPLWLYVSVTGVVIYWLLYHAYAPK